MKKEKLEQTDPQIYRAIQKELSRQKNRIELIASENYTSESVLAAQGSVLTNKYAEGYPGHRYYGGCEFVDIVESLAIERAKKLFAAEHANVQPHSGTQANIAVYLSVLNIGDKILGMSLSHGGHLTHGHPLNFSGKYFKVFPYNVSPETELLDYDEIQNLTRKVRPRMIVSGASAYSRVIDWGRLRKIADSVGAYLMADIAHYAGLVAANIYPSPVPVADFVTLTTHKTLRGPRGGLILCKAKYAQALDKMVFPGTQGGPLMHVIAGKAVALQEATKPSFRKYQQQVVKNARIFAAALERRGFRIVSGGTDCHLFLVDLRKKGITGRDAEIALDKAGITVNKNTIPYDPEKPMVCSGIRLGTPAVTTRGMREQEMELIAKWIEEVLINRENPAHLKSIKQNVEKLCARFPVYPVRESHRLSSAVITV